MRNHSVAPVFHLLHTVVYSFFFSLLLSLLLLLLLKRFLVEPGSENGQCGRVLDLGLGPPQRSIVVPQGIRGQHDRQLELDRLLQVARGHDELKRRKSKENYVTFMGFI